MTEEEIFRWWELRCAQNLKAVNYICPLCDQQLDATSEHMLLLPRAIRVGADMRTVTALPGRAAQASSQHGTSGARPGQPCGAPGTAAALSRRRRPIDDLVGLAIARTSQARGRRSRCR